MNTTRSASLLLAAVLTIGVVGAAPATVAAQDDSGVLGDFLDDTDEDGIDWSAAAMATLDKTRWWASNFDPLSDTDEDREKALADRADLQQAFNTHNESIEDYTNARFGGNESAWNVIETTHVRDDGNATQYLVADVSNDSFQNARMVNTTDLPVDKSVTLSGYASDAAHDELDLFVEESVAEDRDVTVAYTTRLAAEYSGYVEPPEGLTND
ncbi:MULTISPECIES: hypothetical protein [Halolamina]|uniref:Uncharacterized protein n=2 Tax=Halolamina TaxID=1075397 RepID=A0A1I5VRR5_9EURY|nr:MULTISPECIES: hypothetical protein [Halolamina]NHX37808.1 hypothetical protein [Halolamina sp. R1-12]SFQ10130.1 hypothetical protein SAMN05216277_11944 [Halolamina pelagica]